LTARFLLTTIYYCYTSLLFVDIHSIILSGLDGGACDFGEAVEMLRTMESGGTKHIIATLHYIAGTFRNDARMISQFLDSSSLLFILLF
jgi:tyrosine-protein phosphatase YwqE